MKKALKLITQKMPHKRRRFPTIRSMIRNKRKPQSDSLELIVLYCLVLLTLNVLEAVGVYMSRESLRKKRTANSSTYVCTENKALPATELDIR